MRPVPFLEDLLADARYALKTLRRSPGFALVAIVTLALAVGAVTTTYSVVSGVALRSLAYAEPEQLVSVRMGPFEYHARDSDSQGAVLSSQSLDLVRAPTRVFEAAAAFYSSGQPVLTGLGDPERVNAFRVPPAFFAVLGVQPRLGRVLIPEDAMDDRAVVVLSHRFWISHFGGAPDVVGRTLTLDGVIHEVVGVMPPRFDFPVDTQLWQPAREPLPVVGGPADVQGQYEVLGRLAPDITLQQAQARLGMPFAAHAREYPGFANWGPILTPLPRLIVGTDQKPLLMLLSAVALVLLIACANVAAVLLARGVDRQRELAVRRSLGASRGRTVRLLLLESMLLAMAAGTAGVLLAYIAVPLVVALIGEQLPRATEIAVDGRVLMVAIVITVLTGLLAGLLPALASLTEDLTSSLRGGGAGGGMSAWRGRAGEVLVVVQVGLGTLVLTAAALLGVSFLKLTRIDFGFDPERVLVAELRLPADRYDTAQRQRAFLDEVLEGARALPWVQAVAVSDAIPFQGAIIGGVELPGRETPEGAPWARFSAVSPDFFEVMAMRLIRGRGFRRVDIEEGIVIVNEAFARAFFPREDPIGRTVRYLESRGHPEGTIAGIVSDVRQEMLEPAPPQIYYPITAASYPKLSIRTAEDPAAVAVSLRDLISSVDPLLPIDRMDVLAARVSESIARERFYTVALSAFSVIALLITALGLYGLTTYTVGRRTREIGIRVALGATASHVRAATIGRTTSLALAGVLLGLIGAAFGTRVLDALLFGLSPRNPMVFGGVALVLAAVALLAAYPPARQAARVDPMMVLRTD